MRKSKLSKKMMALLLSLLMIVSLVPVSAFAGVDPSQVVHEGTTDKTPPPPEVDGALSANGKVKLTKTIEQVSENNFDITLQVKTTEEMSTTNISKDAAVVFVMDVSGSMRDNTVEFNGERISRFKAAKESAKLFIDEFVKDRGDGARHAAVVTFNEDAKTAIPFMDISTDEKATSIKEKIGKISVGGNTNIEAGLLLARNVLADFQTKNPTIKNLYVVLLSDGVPGRGIGESDLSNKNIREIKENTKESDDYEVKDNLTSKDNSKNIPYMIKTGCGASLYSIAFGKDSSRNLLEKISTGGKSGVFSANSGDELFEQLKVIAGLIKATAEAWIITDPMGEFMEFDETVNSGDKGFSTTDSESYKYFDPNGRNFIWSVKNTTNKSEIIEKDGITTYTIKYRIKLNNQAENFVPGKAYETNGTTSLTYLVKKLNENKEVTDFITGKLSLEAGKEELPSVKGFAGDLTLKKVATHDKEKTLKGAKFTLTDGNLVYTSEHTGDDGLITFKAIPSGHSYALKEKEAPVGYDKLAEKYTVDVKFGKVTVDNKEVKGEFTIENTLHQEKATVPVQKTWEKRAATNAPGIEVTLVAKDRVTGAELYNEKKTIKTAAGAYASEVVEFANVPKDINAKTGNPIELTATEGDVEGFTPVEGYPQPVSFKDSNDIELSGFVFKNKEVNKETVNLNVVKEWIDAPNATRPESITVTLFKDGVQTDKTLTLTADGNWSGTFENLPLYNDSYKVAQYSIVETNGTDTAYSKYDVTITEGTANITNIIKQEEMTISGTKTWKDEDSSKRPTSIFISLMKIEDGKDVEVQSREEVKPDKNGDWKYKFKPVEKYTFAYDAEGKVTSVKENVYKISEEGITGYDLKANGTKENNYNLVNVAKGTTRVDVSKVWIDEVTAIHGDVTVELLANGYPLEPKQTRTFSDTASFEGLDEFDKEGKPIAYTVVESSAIANNGFTVKYDVTKTDNGTQIKITNTVVNPSNVAVSIQKIWQAPKDVVVPDVTMELQSKVNGGDWSTVYTDGTAARTLVLNGETTSGTFDGLPKYEYVEMEIPAAEETPAAEAAKSGEVAAKPEAAVAKTATVAKEIEYRVVETTELENYTKGEAVEVTNNNFTITNTIKGTVNINGTKKWIVPQGEAVPNVTIKLLQNGEAYKDVTLTNGTTSFSFTGLPKYDNEGAVYEYTLAEAEVSGYSASGDIGKVSFENDTANVEIVNRKNITTSRITGSKHWIDPATTVHSDIDVVLYQNDVEVASFVIEAAAGPTGDVMAYEIPNPASTDGWADYYEDQATGVLIPYEYRVEERVVPEGYEVRYEGFEIYNILKQNNEFSVLGKKIWSDPTGTTHEPIELQLMMDGEAVAGKKVTLENGEIAFKFTGLDQFKNDTREPHVYSVKELTTLNKYEEPVYGKEVDGTVTVTNKIKQDSFNIDVTKTWDKPADFVIPEIEIGLYVRTVDEKGMEIDTLKGDVVKLTVSNLTHTFRDLPMYNEQNEYVVYVVKELTDIENCEEAKAVILTGEKATATALEGLAKAVEVKLVNTVLGYQYKVNTYYTTYTNGVAGATTLVEREIIKGAPGQEVKMTEEQKAFWKVIDAITGGSSYDYVKKDGQTVEEVKLDENGKIYEINLYYERRITTPTPPPTDNDEDPVIKHPVKKDPTPPVIIEDPKLPLEELPIIEEIPEELIPLEEMPIVEAPPVEYYQIEEVEVPLGDAPATGDNSNVGVFAVALAAAAVGLIAVLRKKETEEDK